MTIEELKALEQAAGAIPWRFDGQEITEPGHEALLIQAFDECEGSEETGTWREYSSRFGPAEFAVVMRNLAPEILALVDAVNRWKAQHDDWKDRLWNASDAFTAKLEAL